MKTGVDSRNSWTSHNVKAQSHTSAADCPGSFVRVVASSSHINCPSTLTENLNRKLQYTTHKTVIKHHGSQRGTIVTVENTEIPSKGFTDLSVLNVVC